MSAPERSAFITGRQAFMAVGVIALACVGGQAVGQPAAIAQGQQIAAAGSPQGVPACVGCHGAKGEGIADFPRLAGTGRAYIQAQLDAFASGARKSPTMQPFAQKLSPEERVAVAAYYSQLLPPAAAQRTSTPPPSDLGGWLATRGRWADQLPGCAQCHGADGSGVGLQFPPLAGLSETYISAQLKGWKTHTRPPGPLGLMPAVASKLSDADVAAVARYYAGLLMAAAPATAPNQAANPVASESDASRKK